MQNLTPAQRIAAQRIKQGRTNGRQRHMQFLRNVAGATYKHELGLCQVEDSLPIHQRHTAMVAAVKPSSRPVERHTDKYNLKHLHLAALLDGSIRQHEIKYHYRPTTIYLSMHNIMLMALQGYEHLYRSLYGEFRLRAQEDLNDDEIMCE